MSVNFTTPTRRSRRVAVTPHSNRKTRTCTISNPALPALMNKSTPTLAPSVYSLLPIQNSSVSYQVLLPHDIFRLLDDSDVVLVVDMESYGFWRSIAQYLDDTVLVDHSMEQDGLVKYEFVMKIGAFATHDLVSNGSLDDREQLLRYNQGDGLTLVSAQYKGLKYLVRFKDIFTGRIQLYEKVLPKYIHPDFFSAGRTKTRSVCSLSPWTIRKNVW